MTNRNDALNQTDQSEIKKEPTTKEGVTSGQVKKEEVIVHMPMSHDHDVFVDWDVAIRG